MGPNNLECKREGIHSNPLTRKKRTENFKKKSVDTSETLHGLKGTLVVRDLKGKIIQRPILPDVPSVVGKTSICVEEVLIVNL